MTAPRALAAELAMHAGERRLDRDSHVFVSPDGGPIRHRTFYRRLIKPAVQAVFPPELHGLRFHDLRHTCAAILIDRGAHPKEMAEWLGHASVQITLDRYGHLMPHMRERLSARLDEAYVEALGLGVGPGAFSSQPSTSLRDVLRSDAPDTSLGTRGKALR